MNWIFTAYFLGAWFSSFLGTTALFASTKKFLCIIQYFVRNRSTMFLQYSLRITSSNCSITGLPQYSYDSIYCWLKYSQYLVCSSQIRLRTDIGTALQSLVHQPSTCHEPLNIRSAEIKTWSPFWSVCFFQRHMLNKNVGLSFIMDFDISQSIPL